MQIVEFAYYGRIGHFLRAEATANALTYPIPPRPTLTGLVGCVMGFRKDESQVLLNDAEFAVQGPAPDVFWHKANMRKELPNAVPFSIKRSDNTHTSRDALETKVFDLRIVTRGVSWPIRRSDS